MASKATEDPVSLGLIAQLQEYKLSMQLLGDVKQPRVEDIGAAPALGQGKGVARHES
jgi:hypothetical protein